MCVGVGKASSKMVGIFSWGSVLNTDGDGLLNHFVIFAFYQMLAAGISGVHHGADRLVFPIYKKGVKACTASVTRCSV